MKNPVEVNPMTVGARVLRVVEIGIGFFLPLLIGGPFVVLGLLVGMLTIGREPTLFVESACGMCGLLGLGTLFFGQRNISRRRAELSTAGVLAGILAVVWFLGGATQQLRHLDKGAIFWSAVLMPPAILGLRRVILLWKDPRL